MSNFTKLLLNIYTKHKKFSKLRTFIDKYDFSFLNKDEIENIINTCLELNQTEIALVLSRKTNNYSKALEIMILKNISNIDDIFDFLDSLPLYERIVSVYRHGSTLLKESTFKANKYITELTKDIIQYNKAVESKGD